MNLPLRKLNKLPLRTLDGLTFGRLLVAGSRWLSANKETLNRINVFPVVDGDTGTNMAQTLRAVRNAIMKQPEGTMSQVASAVAEASLMGARGNSGMILSHFFTGFADHVGDRETLDVGDLPVIFREVSQTIYDAIDQPVEGTILTVLRESASAPRLEDSIDLEEFFLLLLDEAQKSLKRTPDKLAVLRKAHVVDAGAQGYVYLLEGILREIQGMPLPEVEDEMPSRPDVATVEWESSEFRYCTEAVIKIKGNCNTQKLRETFQPFGDSLIPLISGDLGKVHIHTNNPEEVFAAGGSLGEVIKRKVEDMRTQTQGMNNHVGDHTADQRVRVVADSTCDLPAEMLSHAGIEVVPLKVLFGQETLRDKFDILPDEFYHRLKTDPEHPTTSQPSPEEFSQSFRKCLDSHVENREVFCPVISSHLSGTINSARLASRRVGDGITLWDSGLASTPLSLVALKAAELASAGHTAQEIADELDRLRPKTNTFFMVDTMEYLKRGGRVSSLKALVGSLFDIKPILTFEDGRIVPASKARGKARARQKILDLLAERIPKDAPVRIALGHTGRPDELGPIEDHLRQNYNVKSLYVSAIGSVVGAHVGPGCWGVAYMMDE